MNNLTLLGSALFILIIIIFYSIWMRIRHLTPSNDLSWVNENKYVGDFKGGKRNGQGTYTFANGEIIKVIWKNGELVTPN